MITPSDQLPFYGISIVVSFLVWGIITAKYIWPSLRIKSRTDALRPLLLLHGFRFMGLAFVIRGVVSLELPMAFAQPAAYGDFIASILALVSFALLNTRLGSFLVWIFNFWGTVDLLNAFYKGISLGIKPGDQGAMYFIPTVFVPLLFITHGLMFRLLLMKKN